MPTLDILLKDLSLNVDNSLHKTHQNFVFDGLIELENINFSYEKKPILKNINLKITKGKNWIYWSNRIRKNYTSILYWV